MKAVDLAVAAREHPRAAALGSALGSGLAALAFGVGPEPMFAQRAVGALATVMSIRT